MLFHARETAVRERAEVKFALDDGFDVDVGTGLFKGMASVFNVPIQTVPITVIRPGAFKKTLQENVSRVKILWMHNPHEPIGKPVELKETPYGLHVVGQISSTAKGRDILQLMRDGVVDELSIGFDLIQFNFEDDENGDKIRIVEELKLWDVSPVTWGANEKAKISEVNAVAPMRSFPLADRGRAWDATAADKRVRSWAGGPDKEDIDWNKYFQAHFWRDDEKREEFTGYKLGYVDIIDGQPHAVPRAIFAVAGNLQGARNKPNIPDSDQASIKGRVASWYAKMRREFDDDSIVVPWENEAGQQPDVNASEQKWNEELLALSTKLDELENRLNKALESRPGDAPPVTEPHFDPDKILREVELDLISSDLEQYP